MVEVFGVFSIVKALLLLAVSFFIFFAVSKTDSVGLKQFGRITAIAIVMVAIYSIIITVYFGVTVVSGTQKDMLPDTKYQWII